MPATAPAFDCRLLPPGGPEAVIAANALPIRRAGAVTVVASADRLPSLPVRDRLERRFGPVAFDTRTGTSLDTDIVAVVGPALAARAECRTPARESCRGWSARRTGHLALAVVAAFTALALVMPAVLILILTIWAALTLSAATLLRTLAAVKTLTDRSGPDEDTPLDTPLPRISVLVPLFREREIAGRLIERLSALDYPRHKLDLILVLEADDALTRKAIAAADLSDWMRVVPVPAGSIRTKPRALNYALNFADGEIVGIYDAEDWPAADQLLRVARHFARAAPDVACVQGVLDFYNARQNWLTRCFAIDYATWFRLILPGLARLRLVIPLGGTTLFIKTDVLRRLGAWDAHNVTEDADLGVRLARHGYRVEFLHTVTREEATFSIPAWIRQRSRWIKGYAVTWAVHMRDPVRLLVELGWWRFFGVQVLFLGTLSQFLLAPLLWSFWMVPFGYEHPFIAMSGRSTIIALTVLFFGAEVLTILVNAIAVSGRRHRWLVPWVPVMHLYFPLAAVASWKGLSELMTRPFYWDKTSHGHSPPARNTASDVG